MQKEKLNTENEYENNYYEHECAQRPSEITMVNEDIDKDYKTAPSEEKYSYDFDINESEFVKYPYHTPENTHHRNWFCAQDDSRLP